MMRDATASGSSSSKPLGRPWMVLVIATTLLARGSTAYILWQFQSSQSGVDQTAEISVAEVDTLTVLGRLEPSGEIIRLSAPTSAEGNRVEQLLVKEGDWVESGQVIAVLDSRDQLQAALEEAQEQVRVAQVNLARVRAGAQAGEIKAQRATIAQIEAERRSDIEAQAATVARLEAELQNAQVEYQRYQMLYEEGAVSASLRDSKRLGSETAQRQLQEAKANLNRIRSAQQQQLKEAKAKLEQIAEVRPVDMKVAATEVSAAQAAVERAQANLEQAYVKTSRTSQVLEIHTRAGERVSDEGIAELGQTRQMYAVAEVYESDVSKVRPGQQARVTSDSLPGELQGTVEQVGLQVQRQEVIDTNPAANIDARVVEVRVRLDEASSEKVMGLTNLQITVAIEL